MSGTAQHRSSRTAWNANASDDAPPSPHLNRFASPSNPKYLIRSVGSGVAQHCTADVIRSGVDCDGLISSRKFELEEWMLTEVTVGSRQVSIQCGVGLLENDERDADGVRTVRQPSLLKVFLVTRLFAPSTNGVEPEQME